MVNKDIGDRNGPHQLALRYITQGLLGKKDTILGLFPEEHQTFPSLKRTPFPAPSPAKKPIQHINNNHRRRPKLDKLYRVL